MSQQWIRFFSLPTQAQLEQFEKNTGIVLPPIYKHYLLTANGGHLRVKSVFNIPDVKARVMLCALYGIGKKGKWMDLETKYESYVDELPPGFLAIGEDPGGHLLFIATEGAAAETVYFWDSHCFYKTPQGENVFPVAKDIEQFIQSLYTPDE